MRPLGDSFVSRAAAVWPFDNDQGNGSLEARDQLAARADGQTPSEVIRQALRDYLHAA